MNNRAASLIVPSNDPTTAELPLLEKKHPLRRVSWKLGSFQGDTRPGTKKNDWIQRSWIVARLAILIVLAGIGAASLISRIVRQFGPPQIGYVMCRCGNSTTEALAKGCKFDLLGPSWAPDHCRDDELTAEFLKAGTGPNGTWEFWYDHDHTIPMSIEEVSLLANDPEGAFYGSWEFHVKHCMYQWRKHYRGLERGYTNMDVENTGLGHIQHCEGVILRRLPVRAKIPLNVPYIGWKPTSDDGDHLYTGPDQHHAMTKHQ